MSLDQPTKSWQDYPADELEYHYNPRVTTPDSDRYAEARVDANAAACADARRSADIAYGAGDLRTLDIYRPAGGDGPLPVHIFIHGGYWRARVKEDFANVGKALADNGLLGVVINYPLCPAVTLDEVVASNLAAFEWVHRNIAEHGGDAARITLSGHSAGAHLGAAIIAADWGHLDAGQPLKGAVLVSGIYDPNPTRQIPINAEIGLTPDVCDRHNYLAQAPRLACPVHVLVGGGEAPGWIDQSADYARHIKAAGIATEYTVSGAENHFSIQDQFADPSADVFRAIARLA